MSEIRPRLRAAQYLRMSTEHQRYSTEGQAIANAAWALREGYEIVRTYADEGVSGLRLAKRAGLKALLEDVVAGRADFSLVLVYDVSRWGRFQDPDESAHYEFICRSAGVPVAYTAEAFGNDGDMASLLVKHIKRAMAAEYSRELSGRVSRAKRGLSEKGYWCGGVCSYGFRRAVVDRDGSPPRVLQDGERKALQGCRVVLVAGPDAEVAVVRRIFRAYGIEGLSTSAIARQLNAGGVPAARGAPWTRGRVRRLLTDRKHVGEVVTGRRATRLGASRDTPEPSWIRVPGACPALVPPWLFDHVQANLRRATYPGRGGAARPAADAEILAELRRLHALHGRLSANLLREAGHSPGHVARRFGSLGEAYALAGFGPSVRQAAALLRDRRRRAGRPPWSASDGELLERLRRLHAAHGRLTADLIDQAPDLPVTSVIRKRLGDMMRLCELVGCTPSARQVAAANQAARRRAAGSPRPA